MQTYIFASFNVLMLMYRCIMAWLDVKFVIVTKHPPMLWVHHVCLAAGWMLILEFNNVYWSIQNNCTIYFTSVLIYISHSIYLFGSLWSWWLFQKLWYNDRLKCDAVAVTSQDDCQWATIFQQRISVTAPYYCFMTSFNSDPNVWWRH